MVIVESWIFFFTCAARAAVSFSDLSGSGLMSSIVDPSGSLCQLALQAWPQVGTIWGMPHAAKTLQPLDVEVVKVLQEMIDASGVSRAQIAIAARIGHNRSGRIFRFESPGVTLGEMDALAVALGSTGSEVLSLAEARLRAQMGLDPVEDVPAPSPESTVASVEAADLN